MESVSVFRHMVWRASFAGWICIENVELIFLTNDFAEKGLQLSYLWI
jgi:hypothetical protein